MREQQLSRKRSVDAHIFVALDGVRGLAAIAVAIFHAHPLFDSQLVPGGYLAVDLFFVMSGAVIAHAYSGRLESGMPVKAFVLARVIRFFGFYMIGLAFGVLLAFTLVAVGSPSALSWRELSFAILLGVLFLPFPFGGDIFPLNVPAWSLFYELVVNSLYALFYKLTKTWWLTLATTTAALSLLAGAVVLGTMNFGPAVNDAALALARTTYSFGIGVIVYRYKGSTQLHPFWIVAIVMALLAAPIPPDWRVLFDLLCVYVLFPALVFLLLGTRSSVERTNSIYSFLGAMSYGLYAVHYPLIWLARGFCEKFSLNTQVVGATLIPTLVVLCGVIEIRMDRPLRVWLAKRLIDWPKINN